MFYSQFILAKKGPLGTIWIAAHLERKLRKNQVADTDIGVSVDSILFPEAPIALRLSSHLLLGVVRIYSRKVNYLFDDCSEALLKVKQAFRSAAVDLPLEESTAPYHSITLPETFDLDDFELPDNEIFQGNYVDHHVSTREQITLQDTMDGVVYSTSQFGLDERFGDGDTSQAALDLEEEVFQGKDVIGSEDEEDPGNDHNAYMDAATPNNAYLDATTPNNAYLDAATPKDSTVGVSEAMPRDLNEEQVEDLVAMRTGFNEDAQAPQTPGLVEVPNMSSVREHLACDDHMEVENLNTEEGRKGSGEMNANARESAVTSVEVDKSQIDENVNAQNEPVEERAEHVPITSPCYSHITTEMVDLGQVMTEAGNNVTYEMVDPGQVMTEAGINVNNNVVADTSDAVPPVESPGGPTMCNAEHRLFQQQKDSGEENRVHFAISTEVNQETHYSLQGGGHAYSRPDEQLTSAHPTEELLGNFTEVNQEKNYSLQGGGQAYSRPNEQLNNAHSTEELLGNFTDVNQGTNFSLQGNGQAYSRPNERLNNAQELLGNFTRINQETNYSLQGDGQAYRRPNEQLNNAHSTEELLGNLTEINQETNYSLQGNGQAYSRSNERLNNAQELLGNFTPVNQETNYSVQGDGQAYSRPNEQLNNAQELFGNFTGFANSDLPPPEKVLAAPIGLGDGNSFMVESTPVKETPGTCNKYAGNANTTGKKRTLTESTLTAESLNSVESVGLFQSQRTAYSVPNDNDLLSSILVGKSSFLKMRPTPVLEATTTKRLRSAPRSTTKRKALMDDPMVLHGDIIRHQLTNTDGIRRVRKKAPCTIPEILMLQRKALGDELLKQPIFTGMSVEIVSLHNEPYDLRGIMIIENDDRRTSVGVVGNNQCSVSAVEENKTEESYVPQESNVPQALPPDIEEQPAEVHDHPEELEIIHQQEEMKDDNELVGRISDLEVLKEGNGAADEVNLVLSDEISQLPSEDKVDRVEDLQVEGSHENHDGGLWGKDAICADLNEKSCTEVIEIAEGDIDNNAIFNETDLKVEDEFLREDKKMDASAEINESGIENWNPCDKTIGSIETGCVEAVDLSNQALENCNEPLAEANNDGVNLETESYNKDEPHNEVSNEEAYIQNELEGEPTRDGLMGDNDEMDTMEVEHDTGFLNVDDDEVDEDHEDDDTQYGEETRLLENSGWSSRTRAVAKYLQTLFEKEAENGKNVLVADKLLTGKTRREASRLFFETLVLKTRDYVQVEQAKPYESIIIKPRPKLTKSIF